MSSGKAKLLWQLFCTTFTIGALTFGGGYAMISVLDEALVTKHGWLTEEEMMDLIAIAEMTPGPIAINASTYVGTKMAGVLGAICATFGMVLPSLLIIGALSTFYLQVKDNAMVAAALKGIRAGVVALVISAVLRLWKKGVTNNFGRVLFALALAAVVLMRVSPMLVIVFAAVAGMLFAREQAVVK